MGPPRRSFSSRGHVVEDRGYVTECWIYLGTIHPIGYGVYSNRYAHVLAYEEASGEAVPAGHVVHHRCEQKTCIRPDHLEALTRREHNRRHAKFAPELIAQVRAATGSTRQIAARFGLSKSHAWSIRSSYPVGPSG